MIKILRAQKPALFHFFFDGRLPSANETTAANRSNRMAGASQKKKAQAAVVAAITDSMPLYPQAWPIRGRVVVECLWTCKNKRRDPDNVASAIKIVLDALVDAGVLAGDRWANVGGIAHDFKQSFDDGLFVTLYEDDGE